MGKNAIILCSGGIDSVTTAYYVKKKLNYKELIILFFNYGQKSLISERKCSQKCSNRLNANFIEIKIDWLGKISGSLINKKGKIKILDRKDLKDTKKEGNKFYVPCRNSMFLIYTLALAESIFMNKKEKYDIFVGFKCEGKEAYPDTTIKFVNNINRLSEISCNGKFRVFAPLIKKDKEDIIMLGNKLGIDFRNTFSCYIDNKPCGKCLACMLRKEGFYWANRKDPTYYL